ncbi:hypothetical protein GP486_001929 [Trichoglossum hirsutum]|uniref:DUF7708 domain-containing protein n=1 Tax=Trichoglossum hirsutum TaxID=265104 RepID=A0A9P8LG24_9PEZI|nr:hypothetical protein GP486_001929 [Trichoglossum hirsutum]
MAATASDFKRAVDAFRKNTDLDEAEMADFELTDLQTLRQAINTIQNKQAQNKKLMYMKRLEPFLKSMEDYGKVLEVFLNVSKFISFVWGPMKYLLLVASTFSEALNSLLDAYQQIGEQIPQLLQYQQIFATSPHMGTILAMIYQDILEFHREALKYFKQRSTVIHLG